MHGSVEAEYNAANQVTAINYYDATETRAYNNLMQLTNITTGSALNITYNYTAGSNNGKIGSTTDAVSGETVNYQYDSLNRLISASGSGWTQTQAYDGFGNLTGRTGTGTAQGTTISTPTNATTNQLTGYSYDANGNLISTGYAYDPENRISSVNAGAVEYFYDAQNKRIWEAPCVPSLCSGSTWIPQSQTVNLFGADGKQLASYSIAGAWNNMTTNQVAVNFGAVAIRSYFGGKLVGQQLGTNIYEPVIQDRLGSVGRYYPYGEERNSPQLPNDQVKFATYTRDSATGNDYADQRYYTSTLGRFMTPDANAGTGALTEPGNWNLYTYTGADPINRLDPSGLDWFDSSGLCDVSDDLSDCIGDVLDFVAQGPATIPDRYALWSVFRANINAFAAAALVANLQRTAQNGIAPQVPTYLQFQSACWTIGVPGEGGLGGAAFVLHVTYQVLDQTGKAMSGPQLSTADIAEEFYYQGGYFAQPGNALTPGRNWVYPARPGAGISRSGTITDLLSVGGGILQGVILSGQAFQTFSAGGIANGVPYFQPLEVLGLGAATTVLNNYYDSNYVSINGRVFNKSNTPQCPNSN